MTRKLLSQKKKILIERGARQKNTHSSKMDLGARVYLPYQSRRIRRVQFPYSVVLTHHSGDTLGRGRCHPSVSKGCTNPLPSVIKTFERREKIEKDCV